MRQLLCTLALGVLLTTALAATYAKLEQLTVANSAVGFTAANINNTNGSHPAATSGVCRLELAEVRFAIDGTTPTTTVGTLLEIGDQLVLTGNDTLNNFKAIRTGAVSGQLDCIYTGGF